MADRYWVGGSATWNGTAGTKWATTTGGASGAAAPTAADDVYLDAASGAAVVVTLASVSCRSLNCTGFTGTLSHPASTTLTIGDATAGAGSITLKLVAGMTYTLADAATSAISCVSTSATQQTITTGGKTLGNVTFGGNASSSYLLVDGIATAATATLTHTIGALEAANGQVLSVGVFASNNANTRSLTLGTAAITVTASGVAWNLQTVTGLTLSAASSTITLTAAAATFRHGLVGTVAGNYGTVIFNGSGIATVASTTAALSFVTLTRTGTAAKTDSFQIGGNVAVSGTLTVTGNTVTNRLLMSSNVLGTAYIVTAAAISLSNVDIMDITGAGLAGNAAWTGSSLGNCLGNTNITFDTPVTRYAVAANNWSSTATWAATSGGASGASVPLPQDTVIFDANSAAGTYVANMPRIGKDITCVAGFTRTLAFTNLVNTMFGSLTLVSGMTFTHTTVLTLAGRGSHTITSAGFSFGTTVSIQGGSYTLQDAFVSTGALNLATGTFTANNFNVTSTRYNPSTLTTTNMGSGTWSLTDTTATTIWGASGGAIINPGTSTIAVTTASVLTRTFAGGGKTYNALTYTVAGSSGVLLISGANAFATLNVGSGRIVTFPSSTVTTVTTWNVAGAVNGYQYMPGPGAGSYVSSPDSAALDVTGDLEIMMRLSKADWSLSGPLVSKYTDTGPQYSYMLYNDSGNSGKLRLYTSLNGSVISIALSTAAVAFTAGQIGWLRVTRVAATGAVNFYTSADATNDPTAVSWTLLGTANVATTAGNLFSGSAQLEVGSYNAGASSFPMSVYRVRINNGIGGTVAFDADFTTKAFAANSFAESSANGATVSLIGATVQAGDGRVVINASTPGTAATLVKTYIDTSGNVYSPTGAATYNADNVALPGVAGVYLGTPDTAALSITGDIDIRCRLSMTDWTPASEQTLLGKWSSGQGSFLFDVTNAGALVLYISTTGANSISAASNVSPTIADGAVLWVRVTRRQSDGRTQYFTAPGSLANPAASDFTQLGSDATISSGSAIFDGTAPLAVGGRADAANPLAGSVYRYQVRNGIDGTIVSDVTFLKTGGQVSDRLTVQDSTATGGAGWYAGSHSVNVSGNTGWVFADFTAVSSGDVSSYAGAESVAAAVTGPDTSALTEGTPSFATAVTAADVVAGADVASLAAVLAVTDVSSYAGAESVLAQVARTDSSASTEGAPSFGAAVAGADVVAGTEGSPAIAAVLASSDTGAAADTAAVALALAGADTASTSEGPPVIAALLVGTDVSSYAGSEAIAATTSASDSAAAADTTAVALAVAGADTASTSEGQSVLAAVAGPDALSAIEAAVLAAAAAGAETAGTTDTAAILATALSADASAGTEGNTGAIGTAASDVLGSAESATAAGSVAAADSLGSVDLGTYELAAIPIAASDALSASDAASLSLRLSGVDSVAAADSGALSVVLAHADALSAEEITGLRALLSAPDVVGLSSASILTVIEVLAVLVRLRLGLSGPSQALGVAGPVQSLGVGEAIEVPAP